MQFPYTCTGSLSPTFVPARDVSLPVKRPYAFALCKAGYQSARGHLWKPPLRFWRRPPQSNCPPSSVHQIQVLGLRQRKGRISRTAPRRLASPLQSLRPILHIRCPSPVLSCSKGSRGLFVPSRVIGIFTDTTISLGSRLRQCPDHYTIRAGRNLPDKEFRYLRTVRVTAAVYWGFISVLAHLNLTFQHWAGVSTYTSSYTI